MKNDSGRTRLAAALVLLLSPALFLGSTCSKSVNSTPAPPPAPASGPRVTLPDGFVVQVEVASDDETRAQGLMFRDSVRPGTGMLFLFPAPGDYPFWMKNTLVPLDMIWIDDQKQVVHVAQNVPPCKSDPCPSYPPDGIASFVLELAGGEASRHRVTEGSALKFAGLEGVVVK